MDWNGVLSTAIRCSTLEITNSAAVILRQGVAQAVRAIVHGLTESYPSDVWENPSIEPSFKSMPQLQMLKKVKSESFPASIQEEIGHTPKQDMLTGDKNAKTGKEKYKIIFFCFLPPPPCSNFANMLMPG